jgi:ABC-2 type transport system permease protein
MTAIITIAQATLRSLLGRRRTLLLVLLAALPVVVAVLARIGSGRTNEVAIIDALVVRTVLPLTALVFGTAALGSELDDGTAVYLLTKPIPRWQVIVAKLIVAAGLTAALVGASTLVTGLVSARGPNGIPITIAFTAAVAIGSAVYVAAFLAVSVITTRALVVGLFYTLIWEAALAGLLEGTRILSIREATISLGSAFAPAGAIKADLATTPAAILVAVVLVGGTLLASRRLASYEVRGQD